MGASRKLQGEIDRVLKKVQEGVEVFDSIWNKVYDTDNANQKEKFEADLKKEIKKLQRYRDQIKTWIQSSEIKDKKVSASYEQALMDARKQIEREMERFKICEKEMKTKAFSKEGLGQQPKTDPKEKAKAETRDWLNNVVGELESQIDNFEAEIEGLSVKKGKQRPPRLTHLETSIVRHKAHTMKLEMILRLLDNDELSPEQVNDVKDFLDDYVERNQEDFDEFSDVDELYSTLPLEKVESLEDLVTIGPPSLVKGVGASGAALSLKLSMSPTQIPAAASTLQQATQDHVEETASQEIIADTIPRTPPPKINATTSVPSTPPVTIPTPATIINSTHNFSVPPVSAVLPGSTRAVLEYATSPVSSSFIPLSHSVKEEEVANLPGRRPSPGLSDVGLARGVGRGSLPSQSTVGNPLGSGSATSTTATTGAVSSTPEIAKRNALGADERLGGSGMIPSLVSPLSNRIILPQVAKASDGAEPTDSSNIVDATTMAGRVFSPPVVPGMQWRPGSSFQSQNEAGQFRGRTEIAPDQREKFLQRYQHVQQHGLPSLGGPNHKQFSAQQQSPSLHQLASQSLSSSLHGGLGIQGSSLSTVTSSSLQHPNSIHQQSSQPGVQVTAQKDTDAAPAKVDEQQQNLSGESSLEPPSVSVAGKNLLNDDDDLKSPNPVDTPTGVVSSSSTEPTQVSRDVDLSPGQPLQSSQSSGSVGFIPRRSISELGAIGDNLTGSNVNSGGLHDQFYNLQMLEAAYYKLPQPKDSERAKSYIPRHPTVTPASYPQVQAPIVSNPAFWERLGLDTMGTDTLFFSFYYQQNTYQQYLAAKELKKQSWRYHRKYNTWFQRHEEPKVATDEFEQGTYVYFDFHIANDDQQHGWCQRIKTEFTFEYNYLEDELI